MSQTIQIKRGPDANFSDITLVEGEFALVTDKGKVYIGDGTSKILLNPDLGTVATLDAGTGIGNVVVVQPGGKIDPVLLPKLAITDTFKAGSEAAMLALEAEVGDVAVRTDISKTYILAATPASTLENWVELLFPGAPLVETSAATFQMDGTAAAGSSGKVADAGHVHPTDTSRAPLDSPALTGTPTAPTAAAATNNTQIATTGFVNAFATAKGFLDESSTIDGGTF